MREITVSDEQTDTIDTCDCCGQHTKLTKTLALSPLGVYHGDRYFCKYCELSAVRKSKTLIQMAKMFNMLEQSILGDK